MITPLQLTQKLTELSIEFRKAVDAGDLTTAYIWLINALEFVNGLMEEMRFSGYGSLSEGEKIDLVNAMLTILRARKDALGHFQTRERRKND